MIKTVTCAKCQKPVDAWLSSYRKGKVGMVTVAVRCHDRMVQSRMTVAQYLSVKELTLFKNQGES